MGRPDGQANPVLESQGNWVRRKEGSNQPDSNISHSYLLLAYVNGNFLWLSLIQNVSQSRLSQG